MLRDLWNRLVGGNRDAIVASEAEREQPGPDDRPFADRSIDDIKADEFVGEHLGGTRPDELSDADEPPR